MKCPVCKGNKVVGGFVHLKTVCIPCYLCDGKGTITAQQKKWAVEGGMMYQYRIARQMTLRNEAIRRGMDGRTLSDMEIGKIKPIWDKEIKEKHEDKNRVRK